MGVIMLKVRNLFFIAFLLNSFIFAQDNEGVEEVIVTAQKKEERYVDVPVSVTTVSGEALEIARAGYVQEIVQASPSVTYNRTAAVSYTHLRAHETN